MFKAILFDLDGTLLPMDQDLFVKTYFKEIAKKMAGHGYDPEKLIDAIWQGTGAMVKNDGSVTNEDAFWKVFRSLLGEHTLRDKDLFSQFYENEFDNAKSVCGKAAEAAELIAYLKGEGCKLVLASNPIFPDVAQRRRLTWAGLDPQDFDYITAYENSSFSKPSPNYFSKIAEKIGVAPEDCLMVGNDAGEDTPSLSVGMSFFLMTPCLLNRDNRDITKYPRGGFPELKAYIDSRKQNNKTL